VPLLQKKDLEQSQGRIARRAAPQVWIGESQGLERRPVERLLDPIQKPAALPQPLTIASTNEGWHRLRRDTGESSSLASPPENQSSPLLQGSDIALVLSFGDQIPYRQEIC
jgi:hypothetical protein